MAAVLSAPTPSGTIGTSTTVTFGCTTDINSGQLYGIIDTAANIVGITGAQIVSGFNKNGTFAISNGNATISTTTPSATASSLTAATGYSYAIVQDTGALSNIVTGTFTTSATGGVPKLAMNGGMRELSGNMAG